MGRPSSVVSTWKPRIEALLDDLERGYLAQPEALRTPTIPITNDGMVNLQELARLLGCPRTYLHDYEELTQVIDLFAEGQGVKPTGARTVSVGDQAAKERMAMLSRGAKIDAQAALEARAALEAALHKVSQQEQELQSLKLENQSLKEQLAFAMQGVRVRIS